MGEERLTPAEVQLVLRRAAELERRAPDEALTAAELEAVASEVGLSPAAVTQALAEVRAGALTVPRGPRPLERMLGPTELAVERIVAGEAAEVQRRLERTLAAQLWRKRRDFGARASWEPRPGWWAQLRRALDVGGTQLLGDAHAVESTVVAAGADRTLVRLTADVGALQRRVIGGAVLGTVAGVAAALALWAMSTPPVLEWLAAAGASATGAVGSLVHYRRGVGATVDALERLLDELERPRRPPSPLELLLAR